MFPRNQLKFVTHLILLGTKSLEKRAFSLASCFLSYFWVFGVFQTGHPNIWDKAFYINK